MGSSLAFPGPLAQSWEAVAQRAWEDLGGPRTNKERDFSGKLGSDLSLLPSLSCRALEGMLGR